MDGAVPLRADPGGEARLIPLFLLLAGQIDPPAGPGALGPNLVATQEGAILTWIETDAVRLSRFDGVGWSAPEILVRSKSLFSNWADFPSIALREGEVVGHFLEKSGKKKYAYDVQLLRSTDGRRFARIGPAHQDRTSTEHGFVSIVPEGGGFTLFWLDGRAMASKGPMSLRAARLVGGKVTAPTVLDQRVCECCQTSAAVTSDGPFVVYRDRSGDEIRNISIVRRTTKGWSRPAVIHDDAWKIPGCPVNGPAADANGQRAVVAWYTGADLGKVRVAFSSDSAKTWRTYEVDDHPDASPLGRVDVVLTEAGAVVSWLVADDEKQARILRRHVSSDGRLGRPKTVAATSPARSSGFPRMVQVKDRFLFVWTDVGPPARLRARLSSGAEDGSPVAPRPAKPAEDYEARSLDGRSVSLRKLRGRPVLLNIWATWCGPCRREMPELEQISKAFPDVAVIGVSVDEAGADARVKRVVDAANVSYSIWRDPEDAASVTFGVRALPATLLFDRDGRQVFLEQGALRRGHPRLVSALQRAIEK